MSSIKIQNFGPIKEGYSGNNGFIPIDRFMAFIGNQGSGKSSVVKLISTFSWLEKALFQGKIKKDDLLKDKVFKQYCSYQQIQNYFLKYKNGIDGTLIVYRGDAYVFIYDQKGLSIEENTNVTYRIPKISFIPAERNFLSVIEDAEKVKQLPSTLSWCLEEFVKACRKSSSALIDLPINKLFFKYDRLKRSSYIINYPNSSSIPNYSIRLSEASSGIQSVVPLFIVLDYLNKLILNQKDISYSEEERESLRTELENILSSNFPRTLKDEALKVLFEKYKINYLFNIIEEIEQNLFPDSQRAILNKALEFTNNLPDNKLILTTHSPYIIGYMTLAMKGYLLLDKIKDNKPLKSKLNKIVPVKSCFNPKDVSIYELDMEGNIKKINTKNGVISGKNYLNENMAAVNTLFSELQDIEEDIT